MGSTWLGPERRADLRCWALALAVAVPAVLVAVLLTVTVLR